MQKKTLEARPLYKSEIYQDFQIIKIFSERNTGGHCWGFTPRFIMPTNYKQKEQKHQDSIENILSHSSVPDQAQNHKALCERLLPLATAWENFFLLSIIALPALTLPQEEKLEKIAARHLKAWGEGNQRLCSHCGKKAQITDQFSYYCPQCGNCVNYFWHEGGVK
ncbi:MAG TPA: hypothetical protein DCL61_04755 [Cyanobacteria bacterium UBA12227]|nr:hypothetical protein [Cyanobacteria bacterium UBA12227]